MKLIGLFILLTIALCSNGQNFKLSGTVVNSGNEEELAYANIVVLGKSIGATTNESGYFEMMVPNATKNDSIVISCTGYKPLVAKIDKVANQQLALELQDVGLYDVAVTASEGKIKPLTINKLSKKKCGIRYNSNDSVKTFHLPARDIEPTIEAIYIPYKEEYRESRWLKKISIAATNYKIATSTFNIHIYKATKDLNPGDDLLQEPLIAKASNLEELTEIDIQKYNIEMPKTGLFIGFELLILDENKSMSAVGRDGNSVAVYSPYLNYVDSEEKEFFYLYSKGKWGKISQLNPFPSDNKATYYKPAISLVLSN